MIASRLQIDVQEALEGEPGVEARHITVAAVDGAVMLSGYVSSHLGKIRAIAAAERVPGVKAVADDLEIRIHPGDAKEDSDIAASVAHVLEWNSTLADLSIQAKVSDAQVTLMGEVACEDERDEAARAIGHLLGVRSVVNRITVKPVNQRLKSASSSDGERNTSGP